MSEAQPPTAPANPASVQTAERVVRSFFRQQTDAASIKQNVRRWLIGAVWAVVLIPLLFYLRFGEVGPLGWGVTIFFAVYCLLSAMGLYFLVRPSYHTPVKLRNNWLDHIGAFWLVACAFGPLFGWILTSFSLTESTWRWLYWGRVGLCIGLPVLTALPLLRYVRGMGAPLMLAILLGVTALPVWSGWSTWQDLQAGPITRPARGATSSGRFVEELYLPHTERMLAKR
jgi:hypothetical protein